MAKRVESSVGGDRFAETVLPESLRSWRTSTLGRIADWLEFRLILRLLGELEGRLLLDVGCGDGALLMAAARGAHATGIDPVRAIVAAARELRALVEEAGLVVKRARGAIDYPPWGWAARLLSPLDRKLGGLSRRGGLLPGGRGGSRGGGSENRGSRNMRGSVPDCGGWRK